MERLDKAVIGQRIKQLRKGKGLRQWQMAELLGATQPAVHKYENGILPEVKRLLTLARIGNTSVEWILTGRHAENGSRDIDRLAPEIYDLASQLHAFSAEDRKILADALEIIGGAVRSLREAARREPRELTDADVAGLLRSFESHAREALIAALAVYDSVVTTLSNSKVRDLHRFAGSGPESPVEGPVSIPDLHKNAG